MSFTSRSLATSQRVTSDFSEPPAATFRKHEGLSKNTFCSSNVSFCSQFHTKQETLGTRHRHSCFMTLEHNQPLFSTQSAFLSLLPPNCANRNNACRITVFRAAHSETDGLIRLPFPPQLRSRFCANHRRITKYISPLPSKGTMGKHGTSDSS